jgi:hypothetical protein
MPESDWADTADTLSHQRLSGSSVRELLRRFGRLYICKLATCRKVPVDLGSNFVPFELHFNSYIVRNFDIDLRTRESHQGK